MPKAKRMQFRKTVLMPIEVPVGKYCWGRDFEEPHTRICGHFDNSCGGHPDCDLGFYPLNADVEGRVLKPIKCRDLKEVKNVRRL